MNVSESIARSCMKHLTIKHQVATNRSNAEGSFRPFRYWSRPRQSNKPFERYAARTIISIICDHPVCRIDDPLVVVVNECPRSLSCRISPSASLLGLTLVLQYIRTFINSWKRRQEAALQRARDFPRGLSRCARPCEAQGSIAVLHQPAARATGRIPSV
ncbi:hypothetical protein K437DRAFT_133786 [Tilletiaria anomala UBC 951]|uniref:Uncharacterized protein n=1 Tax=Tilletiaria anomala (strain ATCC 24038 / CBS 436.72 / UBC 951) TaxID=1037660 RepID=A0A066WG72_TILAU|nr:uncharacterized protein K437DRAFT_133786 [Tilletiaria anomala UBC 951]KDN52967.1 hypothetical protein K437DRAFT_133786 [Tilletiaria anomala UBC 951]